MAHEIMEFDNMISVRQRPWHGLGVILTDHPNVQEAQKVSGLDWSASVKPTFIQSGNDFIQVKGSNAVVRDDYDIVIGTVGDRYQVYQNDEMWKFIETFQNETDVVIETAGSLKNGATTWVLAKNGTVEYLNGDPVEEYFLFRNSFNGTSPIMCMFTNIRVVCNNTLSMAVRHSNNIFKVRHTANADSQLVEVQKALGIRAKYQEMVTQSMGKLIHMPMLGNRTNEFLSNVVFPEPKKLVQKGGKVVSIEKVSKSSTTARNNKINAVLKLIETGAGADIKGVKGTGYGVFQALTEWADHEKTVKVSKGRDRKEVKFVNAFWGTGAAFKQDCFNQLLKAA